MENNNTSIDLPIPIQPQLNFIGHQQRRSDPRFIIRHINISTSHSYNKKYMPTNPAALFCTANWEKPTCCSSR